jgi:hypothetical protein
MTFAQLIKILDLLDYDKEIIIQKEQPDGEFSYVDKFSKYDEISMYAKYFISSDYRFFICEDSDFTGYEIAEDGTLGDDYD